MKTKLFLHNEDPKVAQAQHSVSKALLSLVLADGSGYLLKLAPGEGRAHGETVLKLKTQETLRALKDRLRPPAMSKGRPIPRIKAPTKPSSLDLSYPMKGQEMVRHPHEAMRQACIRAQAQKRAQRQASAQAQ
jgi:hypothetical protein